MLLERARSIIAQAKLSKRFWAEVVSTACYLVNRSPHTALNFKSPKEIWYNSPVDYSNLRVFGSPAYIHVSEGKLEPRARKCIFMGYGLGVKGYKVWCEKFRMIITSTDVVFDENALVTPTEENTLTNTAGESNDSQEEVEPPNINETDDDPRHKKRKHFTYSKRKEENYTTKKVHRRL